MPTHRDHVLLDLSWVCRASSGAMKANELQDPVTLRRRSPAGVRARAVLLAAVVLPLAALPACDRQAPGLDAGAVGAVTTTGVEHAVTVDGVRRALLRADTAHMVEGAASAELRRVSLEVFDEDGSIRVMVTAQSAEYDLAARRLVCSGDVVLSLRSSSPQTAWTDELHYDGVAGRLWSDVATRVQGAGGGEITAAGFVVEGRMERLQLRTAPAGGAPVSP
jgi:LPS export ABC transporter protein LptC